MLKHSNSRTSKNSQAKDDRQNPGYQHSNHKSVLTPEIKLYQDRRKFELSSPKHYSWLLWLWPLHHWGREQPPSHVYMCSLYQKNKCRLSQTILSTVYKFISIKRVQEIPRYMRYKINLDPFFLKKWN